MSVGVAWLASRWADRPGAAGAGSWSRRSSAALGFEAALAPARARHGLGVVAGRESSEAYLDRVASRPTGSAAGSTGTCREAARIVGQDHRGFYFPASLHDGAGPPPPDRPGYARRVGRRGRRAGSVRTGSRTSCSARPCRNRPSSSTRRSRPPARALAGGPEAALPRAIVDHATASPAATRSTTWRRTAGRGPQGGRHDDEPSGRAWRELRSARPERATPRDRQLAGEAASPGRRRCTGPGPPSGLGLSAHQVTVMALAANLAGAAWRSRRERGRVSSPAWRLFIWRSGSTT